MAKSNRVAVITGGARGIGKGMARTFTKRGIDVVIADKDGDLLEKTVSELKTAEASIYGFKADISKVDEVDKLFDFTMKQFGQVDILINNAGVAEPLVPITEVDLKIMDEIINVDFKGVFYCSRRAVKEMKPRKSGNIINMGSIDGYVSLPGVVYGPMKAAVQRFTTVLARELASIPIRVNCIVPGLVLTELMEELSDRDVELMLKYVPMHKALVPEDVANLAYFLVSDEARYITGSVITADSGASADAGWHAFGL
ncbi:MAG: SDR family NAD(P)-dependent oxidoreductase [Dehalococcoidia bacterium]|nr:SDR family NAD(P)-dependent oxidoreductase [Dehalococcoidia bacterium]